MSTRGVAIADYNSTDPSAQTLRFNVGAKVFDVGEEDDVWSYGTDEVRNEKENCDRR